MSSTSAKTGRELPVYEPVSPDIDVESPPGKFSDGMVLGRQVFCPVLL